MTIPTTETLDFTWYWSLRRSHREDYGKGSVGRRGKKVTSEGEQEIPWVVFAAILPQMWFV